MYKAMSLPYSYDALEPILDARTIGIHYEKLYFKYLNNLNKILNEIGYDFRYSKEELVSHIDQFPLPKRGDILYNLGGVLNHELYFQILTNPGKKPSGLFKEAIDRTFGNFDNFEKQFIEQAGKVVGSGYTFLVVNAQKELQIISTPNQETPYSYGMIPIMNIDLWEHAYYLRYQSNRDQYIHKFFDIINFDIVGKNYEQALQA